MKNRKITTLFVDIGGVLLNNGWDTSHRERAAKHFQVDFTEMEKRHRLTFDTFESGKISLEEYVRRVIFYEKRNFEPELFIHFMYAQSHVLPDMIPLIQKLKRDHHLKVVAVSNEGRELTLHRIKTFQLDSFMDLFISSCFVFTRKPDDAIYRYALDISHAAPEEVIYIDDRLMFIEVAEKMGIQGIHHIDYQTTLEKLNLLLIQ